MHIAPECVLNHLVDGVHSRCDCFQRHNVPGQKGMIQPHLHHDGITHRFPGCPETLQKIPQDLSSHAVNDLFNPRLKSPEVQRYLISWTTLIETVQPASASGPSGRGFLASLPWIHCLHGLHFTVLLRITSVGPYYVAQPF